MEPIKKAQVPSEESNSTYMILGGIALLTLVLLAWFLLRGKKEEGIIESLEEDEAITTLAEAEKTEPEVSGGVATQVDSMVTGSESTQIESEAGESEATQVEQEPGETTTAEPEAETTETTQIAEEGESAAEETGEEPQEEAGTMSQTTPPETTQVSQETPETNRPSPPKETPEEAIKNRQLSIRKQDELKQRVKMDLEAIAENTYTPSKESTLLEILLDTQLDSSLFPLILESENSVTVLDQIVDKIKSSELDPEQIKSFLQMLNNTGLVYNGEIGDASWDEWWESAKSYLSDIKGDITVPDDSIVTIELNKLLKGRLTKPLEFYLGSSETDTFSKLETRKIQGQKICFVSSTYYPLDSTHEFKWDEEAKTTIPYTISAINMIMVNQHYYYTIQPVNQGTE